MAVSSAARKSGAFLSDLALELTGESRPTGWGRRYEKRLVNGIAFEMGAPGSGLIIYVPRGYITDGFSMPGKILQAFQPLSARFLLPAILHDWLYDTGRVPRAVCDRVLLQAMRAVGAPEWQCRAVYYAIRIGGRGGFGKPLPVNIPIVADARTTGVTDAVLAYLANPAPLERKSSDV